MTRTTKPHNIKRIIIAFMIHLAFRFRAKLTRTFNNFTYFDVIFRHPMTTISLTLILSQWMSESPYSHVSGVARITIPMSWSNRVKIAFGASCFHGDILS